MRRGASSCPFAPRASPVQSERSKLSNAEHALPYLPPAHQGQTEKLAIFGPRRGRRGAQLKVMAAVETKVPEYFTAKMEPDEEGDADWGTKTLVLKQDELSYALGKKGMTRKKLAKSSGCIVE